LYQYQGTGAVIRKIVFNEIFSTSSDTIVGAKIQFYSNKWFEVGVNSPNISQSTIFAQSRNGLYKYRLVIPAHAGICNNIFDVFGNCVLTTPSRFHRDTPPEEGNLRLDVSNLPPGVYFVRVGNEKPQKFMVVR